MLTHSRIAQISPAGAYPPVGRPIADPRPLATPHLFMRPVVRELARPAPEPLAFASTW